MVRYQAPPEICVPHRKGGRKPLSALLSGLTIGALTLTPDFAPEVKSYAVTTSNATNKVTATPEDEHATVEISVNGTTLENGGSAAWNEGDNTVLVTVTSADNSTSAEYTVAATKE